MQTVTWCVPIRDACRGLSALIGRVRYGRDRVVLTSRGRAACAIVSVADLEHLERAKPSAKAGVAS
jgi:prevent-host-death family protein